jgi:cytochrome c-type biogenesis protein CcmE
MSKGPIITGLVAAVALSAVVGAFLNNASPYAETIAEARTSRDDRLHLTGDIVPGTVRHDVKNHTIQFRLRDKSGEEISVVHRGDPPANMGEATKVVAVGQVKDGAFQSDKLLIKCPSKYEGEKPTADRGA